MSRHTTDAPSPAGATAPPTTPARPIAISEIAIDRRLRDLRPAVVASLAGSIRDAGLLEPIGVVRNRSGYRLVFGAHRLEACRRLGWTEIPAHVLELDELSARLAEIDENLVRADLTALEQAVHLTERKRVYLALHPETASVRVRGGPGRGKKTTPESGVVFPPSFVEDTAQKTGAGRSTVFAKVQIGEALEPVADRLKGTPVEDNQSALLELARLADEDRGLFERVVDVIATDSVPLTEARRRVAHAERPRLALPDGTYRVIYADPPWEYSDTRAGLGRGDGSRVDRTSTAAAHHYPTMNTDELCALDVRSLAADDAVLFCWATFPLLPDALRVVRAWGFEYKTAFVWWKPRGSFGHYHKADAELLLLCTRGSCTPDADAKPSQIIRADGGPHSRKPEEARALIDLLYPHGPAIELFARRGAGGRWRTWGNDPALGRHARASGSAGETTSVR